jgi:hypothetical protein
MTTRVGQWLRDLFGKPAESAPGEPDVESDPKVARSRSTGGEPGRDEGDAQSTTGPGETGTFVGRVAGDDDGGASEESGAEARGR